MCVNVCFSKNAEDMKMNKPVFIGIYVLLVTILGFLSQIAYYQYVKKGGDDFLSIANLEKYELAALKKYESPDRSGKVNIRQLEKFENSYLTLARQDVHQFFDNDIPLDEPNIALSYLMTWVALAVPDTMTFGFSDYKWRLSMSSRYFTDNGWSDFAANLKRSRILETIEKNQQMLTTAPRGAPIIQSMGVVSGRYQWVVKFPLTQTYLSGAKTSNHSLLVTVVVRRSDDKKHPYGIAIDKFIAQAR